MEFTLPTLTLSALLASFSGDGLSNGPVITTHTKSVISGQWQILLDEDKQAEQLSRVIISKKPLDTTVSIVSNIELDNPSDSLQENTLSTEATEKEKERYLKRIFSHNNHAINAIYKKSKLSIDSSPLPAIITIEELRTQAYQTNDTARLLTQKEPQCRELYNFDQDNQVRVSSGAELTLGKYVLSHQDDGLPIIVMTTIYDNNEKDCSGIQIDQTGESMIAYLKYMGNKMSWCSDAQGKNCSVYFNRLYP